MQRPSRDSLERAVTHNQRVKIMSDAFLSGRIDLDTLDPDCAEEVIQIIRQQKTKRYSNTIHIDNWALLYDEEKCRATLKFISDCDFVFRRIIYSDVVSSLSEFKVMGEVFHKKQFKCFHGILGLF
uniref:Uncharacterized protein n=1 Tax=Amphora coffeiformis TaxID=265554 RepID=A0A7S3P8E1_9STRA|mmetsp:Transcript_8762/g.16709  ORF Transcript_8762/g.16709 Transcript_8762/m.16709 type:complete len:126 (-) Transcript_8762:1068-1445(-)